MQDSSLLSRDLSSEQYHTTANTFSSSQLKTMLEDPENFYKQYITKELPRKEASTFDVGTYFHTAILEPHLLEKECAIFQGAIRRGKEWDAFKELNKGKAIITKTEHESALGIIAAVKNSPIAMSFIDGYEKEVSAFLDVYVLDKKIFFIWAGETVYRLKRKGWEIDTNYSVDSLREFGVKIRLKVRADAISFAKKTISDLKSTTGNAKSEYQMRSKIDSYSYDLSASLYLDIFSACSGEDMRSFVWLFASKDFQNCKSWVASEKNVQIGRAKWSMAVIELAHYISNDWLFEDSLGTLEPSFFQTEYIEKIEE